MTLKIFSNIYCNKKNNHKNCYKKVYIYIRNIYFSEYLKTRSL